MEQGRIAVLDGWRGIAILMVLTAHLCGYCGLELPLVQFLGQHGVTLFFVLSGFLITNVLLREQESTGSVSLRGFYLRRFFRLMPVAWLYLAIAFAFRIITPHDLLACGLFFRNFAVASVPSGHFWSLSIEEQFYLAWPALLLLSGRSRARKLAIVTACVIGAVRFVEWQTGGMTGQVTIYTWFRADALLIGCFFALSPRQYKPLFVWTALAVLVVCVSVFREWPPLAESLAAGYVIANGQEIFRKVLSLPALTWIGRISYSLYVWQQPVLISGWRGWQAGVVKIALVFVLACLSYYCVEQPIISMWRRRGLVHAVNLNSAVLEKV